MGQPTDQRMTGFASIEFPGGEQNGRMRWKRQAGFYDSRFANCAPHLESQFGENTLFKKKCSIYKDQDASLCN